MNVVNIVNVTGRRRRPVQYITVTLGVYKSRGYRLEMITADFLAGASLEASKDNTLSPALVRLIAALAMARRQRVLDINRTGFFGTNSRASFWMFVTQRDRGETMVLRLIRGLLSRTPLWNSVALLAY